MKKQAIQFYLFFLVLFLSLVIIPTIQAIEIKILQPSYQPSETLQAEITGNFISLNSENILIYENNAVHSTPILSDLFFKDSIYYFYAILPNKPGNYSLKIENSQYQEQGQPKTETIVKNFIIQETNKSSLQIIPGFISTEGDFSIGLISIKNNQQITATFNKQTKNISLIEGIQGSLKFSVTGLPEGKTILKIQEYEIPIFVTLASGPGFVPEIKSSMIFRPSELTGTIATQEKYFFRVLLENNGKTNLTNITLSNNIDATLEPSSINLIPDEKIYVNVSISAPKKQGNFTGKIIAKSGNVLLELPIYFDISENKTQVSLSGTSFTESSSCSDMGNVCFSNQTCKGETTLSKEGLCCKGTCVNDGSKSSTIWIGIIIIILVILMLGFFYFKSKRGLKPKSTEEILEEKKNRFESRMKLPESSVREVSGDLTRV